MVVLFCRYDEIETKMIPFLKSSGYNVKKGNDGFLAIYLYSFNLDL